MKHKVVERFDLVLLNQNKNVDIVITESDIANLLTVKEFLDTSSSKLSLREVCYKLGFNYNRVYKTNVACKVISLSRNDNGKFRKCREYFDKKIKLPDAEVDNIRKLYYKDELSMKSIAKKYDVSAATVCHYFKKHSIVARSKETAGKIAYRDESKREAIRKRMIDRYLLQRKTDTAPERAFKEWLNEHNIRFVEQYRAVGNGHPYDFFLIDYNLLVEIDGTYWHSKPEQKVKDAKHVEDAIKRSYNIVRIDTKELDLSGGDYNKWLKILI